MRPIVVEILMLTVRDPLPRGGEVLIMERLPDLAVRVVDRPAGLTYRCPWYRETARSKGE